MQGIPPACDDPGGGWSGGRVRDDGVVEISGDFTLRPSAGMDGVVFRSCPVAAVDRDRFVPYVFRAYRMFDAGALHLIEPNPSNALLDAIDLVASEFVAVRAYERSLRASSGPS